MERKQKVAKAFVESTEPEIQGSEEVNEAVASDLTIQTESKIENILKNIKAKREAKAEKEQDEQSE